jgi:hypothetical protein
VVAVAQQAQILAVPVVPVGSLLAVAAEAEVQPTELVALAEAAEMALLLSILGKQLCQFQINHPRLTIKSVHPR